MGLMNARWYEWKVRLVGMVFGPRTRDGGVYKGLNKVQATIVQGIVSYSWGVDSLQYCIVWQFIG